MNEVIKRSSADFSSAPFWIKEHRNACQKGALEKSALAEHAWKSHHPIKWEETTAVDQARTPRSCCWRRQSTSGCSNPPLTGMEDWSCLDAGWQPGEQWSRDDPSGGATSVTANDATHGYKWQVLTLASYICPEEDQSSWSKCRQGSNPAFFQAGIGELPLSQLPNMMIIRITWKGGYWDVCVGSGLSFRQWEGEGRCQGSCSEWIFWSEWLLQSFSARTLRLVFELWRHPNWCNGLFSEYELQGRIYTEVQSTSWKQYVH